MKGQKVVERSTQSLDPWLPFTLKILFSGAPASIES